MEEAITSQSSRALSMKACSTDDSCRARPIPSVADTGWPHCVPAALRASGKEVPRARAVTVPQWGHCDVLSTPHRVCVQVNACAGVQVQVCMRACVRMRPAAAAGKRVSTAGTTYTTAPRRAGRCAGRFTANREGVGDLAPPLLRVHVDPDGLVVRVDGVVVLVLRIRRLGVGVLAAPPQAQALQVVQRHLVRLQQPPSAAARAAIVPVNGIKTLCSRAVNFAGNPGITSSSNRKLLLEVQNNRNTANHKGSPRRRRHGPTCPRWAGSFQKGLVGSFSLGSRT